MARRLEPLLQHRLKTLYFTVFWSKLFGQKACTIVTAWVENTVIYSVLEQVVLNHCYYMGKKHLIYSVLEQVVWPEGLYHCYNIAENTVIYSVLEQVVWPEDLYHCYNIARKHCNLQCFGASCFEALLLHG